MHSYLRAIGFSNLKKGNEIEKLLEEIVKEPDQEHAVNNEAGSTFIEYSKKFGDHIGITVCGTLDEEGFHQEYYFPYFKGSKITTKEDLVIEKRAENDSFTGVCEDMRVGVSLIFYLLNAAEYQRKNNLNLLLNQDITTTFSGLSVNGKILLPICKNENQLHSDREATRNRSYLISEARKGNEEAIESLTLDDIDTYTMVSRRLQREDVFTIVDSFFMPYGMECDHYHIMGEVKEITKVQNRITGEQIYQLSLICNEMEFDICIKEEDLQGEPEIGRRFKGVILLQGYVNFPEVI